MTAMDDTVALVRTRLAAWLVFGPLGHLAAGVTDWVVLLAGWQLAELKARRAASRSG
jgi:hypothetical protein